MSSCNDEYFIAFPPNDHSAMDAIPLESTVDRGYGCERIISGKPLHFYEEDPPEGTKDSSERNLPDVFFSVPHFGVSDWLKEIIAMYPIQGCQLVPTTLTDHRGTTHQGFWFVNVYISLDVLDIDKSDIRGDRNAYRADGLEDRRVRVRKTSLDCQKLKIIPKQQRMIFRISGVARRRMLVHEELVAKFQRGGATGIRFFRVSEFVEGMQHR